MHTKDLTAAARLPHTSAIVAPKPEPDAIDVLAHFFPQSPVVRALRVFRDICPPIVHSRR